MWYFYVVFIQIYQIYSDFISVLFDFNWFQLISYDFIWQLLNFGWQLLGRMAGHIAERCWDFFERKEKMEKIETIELEKSWKIEEIEEIEFFEAAAVGETGWHSKHNVL